MDQQISEFLDFLTTSRDRSANTIAAYRNDLTQFSHYIRNELQSEHRDTVEEALPADVTANAAVAPAELRKLEEQVWSDLPPDTLKQYMKSLQANDAYASSTVARKVAAVKSFLGYLQEQQVVAQNPFEDVTVPKVEKSIPRTICMEEIARLLAAPAQEQTTKARRDKALLELLYATGMRVTELVNLDVSDVDLRNKQVHCGIDSNRRRTIPIYEPAVEAIVLYLELARDQMVTHSQEPALFLNHRGQRLTRQGLWLIIKRYVKRIGIQEDITPHMLRHSFAVHALDRGMELSEIKERLGHANLSTTQIYRRADDEAAELVIDGKVMSN